LELFTSHWRSALLADADAVIVSISRGQPRWPLPFRYRRLPELAPNDATWALEDEREFAESYVRQLERLAADAILERLEGIGGGRPVVCLCWEKPHEEFCHRWLLSRHLEERTGLAVPELESGMLPEREDTPEQRLF
jgi:hypothetical protein